jgi:dihydroorotate dehydrogenase (NAD+) catalytic subunit
MAVDLTTRFCGLDFKNPIIVAAGAHGRDGDTIKETSRWGVSAVCTKTIVSQPATDVLPCFAKVEGGMLNAVFGSDKTAEYWFTEGIKRAKEGEALVIANLAGFTPQEGAELAHQAQKAGADVIELPTHCPHMGEILNAMFPGMNFPEPKLLDVAPMQQSVRLMKEAVQVPVVVKLSGTFSNIVREWTKGVEEAGADGIACSDALGPAISIDPRTGQPVLGGPRGAGGLTGPAIKPITLRMVLDIAMTSELPIVGVGGVTKASDAIEYIMAGATLVGLCTAGHLNSEKRYRAIVTDLEKLLEELGAKTPSDIKGLTLRRIEERKRNGKVAVTKPVVPVIDEEKCTDCGICETACVYGAISTNGRLAIDKQLCTGCGLCVTVCPTGALKQLYY